MIESNASILASKNNKNMLFEVSEKKNLKSNKLKNIKKMFYRNKNSKVEIIVEETKTKNLVNSKP